MQFIRVAQFSWVITILVIIFSVAVKAGVGLTYQGRILKPDGQVISSSDILFKVQIWNPGKTCLLYQEKQRVDLSTTNGVFALTVGAGTVDFVVTESASAPENLSTVFRNRGSLTGQGGCSYGPGVKDERLMTVTFQDLVAGGAEEVIPDQTVSHVPFAVEAHQVSGYKAENLLRVADETPVAPLTLADYNKLVSSLGGTSGGALRVGSDTTTCAAPVAGAIRYNSGTIEYCNGSAWTALAAGGAVNSVSSANADISVATGTTTPVLTLNSTSTGGAGNAGKVVKLDGSGMLASSMIPDFDMTKIITGTLAVARGGTNSSAVLNNNRVMVSSGGAIVEAALIAGDRVLVSNASGIPTHSAVTATEIGYVSGVTSAIQAQIDGKAPSTGWTNFSVIGVNGLGALTAVPGTTSGTILQHSPTGPVYSSAVYPSTTTANQLLYSSSANVISGLTTQNNAVLMTNGSGVPAWSVVSNDVYSQYALLAGRAGGQILNGGTSASDSLTLNSTTNATKGNILLNPSGGFVGIGTATPAANLDIRNDGGVAMTNMYSVGGGNGSQVTGYRANGSMAAPTSLTNGQELLNLCGSGYGATGWSSGTKACLRLIAAENWTDAAQGTSISFLTTPTGSTTQREVARFNNSGYLGINTATPGEDVDIERSGSYSGIRLTNYRNTDSGNRLISRRAQGTSAAPLALANNSTILQLDGWGYGATGWSAARRIAVDFEASEAWTDTAQGTKMQFYTTPNGGTVTQVNMTLDGNGRLGIGDETPDAKLDVETSGEPVVDFKRSDADDNYATLLMLRRNRSDTTPPGLGFGGYLNFALEGFTDGVWGTAGSLGTFWANAQTDDSTSRNSKMAFNVTKAGSSVQRMVLTGDGVGIGTSAPSGRLEVINNDATFGGNSASIWNLTTNPSNGNALYASSRSTYTTNSAVGMKSNSAETYVKVDAGVTASGGAMSYYGRTLRNGDTGDSSGISTSIIGARFDYGHANVSAVSPESDTVMGLHLYPQRQSGTITNMYDIYISADVSGGAVTNRYGIYQAGNNTNYFNGSMGIGKNNPAYKLDVVGDINASGSVRAAGVALTSDARFKRDIASIESPLEKLLQLRGVTYYWKQEQFPDKHFSDRRQLGVIAQEVESVFPEAVDKDRLGYRAVNYTALVAPLIEAVRELFANKADKAEVEKLRSENAALKAWICQKDPEAALCK